MIETLNLRNLGGISNATLRFSGRFIAITGESGAGKTSLVRALELLSGKRAQSILIRYGEDISTLCAHLLTRDPYAPGVESIPVSDGKIFIKREIYRNGRSKCYLQDQAVPLGVLAECMDNRLRIQSQFAQLDLLEPEKQLRIVDSCGGAELASVFDKFSAAYTRAYRLEREVRQLKKKETEVLARFKDAEVLLDIIDRISPYEDCENEWKNRIDLLNQELSRNLNIQQSLFRFKGNETEKGLLDQLQETLPVLVNISSSEKKEEFQKRIDQILDRLNELLEMCGSEVTHDDLAELQDEIERIERKIGLLRKAKRLAGVDTVAQLLDYSNEARNAISWLSRSRKEISEKEEQSRSNRKEASEEALKLRNLRQNTAENLSQRVNWSMRDLAMVGTNFEVQFSTLEKLRERGIDEVQFLLRNTEGFCGPIQKVASGGELSRLLLSIEVSLPDDQLPDTIVFDEVEAGLGGRAAVLAGYKLKELSSKSQVILITHEASIAAIADQHFMVSRDGEEAEVHEVKGEERVRELARMLSGDYALNEALEHARKLLTEKTLLSTSNY